MPNDFHHRGDDGQSFIHGIHHEGSLKKLLTDAVLAYRERTQVLQQQSVDIGLIGNRLENIHGIVFGLQQFNGKVDEFMATQEERLQAILVAVRNVKQMLADLKVNNPAIEDEITAIEAELAPVPTSDNPPEG